jgi:GrpB-like predicted nucleotidyltransferase (UPF0157 family)
MLVGFVLRIRKGSAMDQTHVDNPVILPYDTRPASYHPYDPRAPEVAARLLALIAPALRNATVEHIGSTAIPGCAGKGVIDLMVVYEPGDGALAANRAAVERLGFVQWKAPRAHPDERPVMVGAIEHDGDRFRIHCHLIATDNEEIDRQRTFRDRLRADPALVAEYEAVKQGVLARGITYGPDYSEGKDEFIKRIQGGAD